MGIFRHLREASPLLTKCALVPRWGCNVAHLQSYCLLIATTPSLSSCILTAPMLAAHQTTPVLMLLPYAYIHQLAAEAQITELRRYVPAFRIV